MNKTLQPLRLNLAASGHIKGQDLAHELAREAREIGNSVRQVLKNSCLLDISKFLEDRLQQKFTTDQIEYIFSAAFAGGSYALENLPSRIIKLRPSLKDEELARLCLEVETIIKDRKKDIDSVRTTTNSVITVFGDIAKSSFLSSEETTNSHFQNLEDERIKVNSRKISNKDEFLKWVNDTIDLYRRISERRTNMLQNEKHLDSDFQHELISAKRKKGFVSTKSIDTYEKRIGDFVNEFVQINNQKQDASFRTISNLVASFNNHSANSKVINSMLQNLDDNGIDKYRKSSKSDSVKIIGAVQELEHFIGDRLVKISFTNDFSLESIKQVLNSLRAQLASKRTDGRARHKIGDSFLSVEVNGLKKGDIEEIEMLLRLNMTA